MFENYGPYLEILELAKRLAKANIHYELIPGETGWALIFSYKKCGEKIRAYTLIVDDHSLDRDKYLIEVNEGDVGNVKRYSLDQDSCYKMIYDWYLGHLYSVII